MDNIQKRLREQGEKIIGTEGYSEGHWVLVDSADVVAHVFYEPYRKFYDIESLWIDTPRVKLNFEKQIPKKQSEYGEIRAAE